jgi:hypothetical protein
MCGMEAKGIEAGVADAAEYLVPIEDLGGSAMLVTLAICKGRASLIANISRA